MKRINRKKKKIFSIICKFIAIISTIIALVFIYNIFKVDLLSSKFLIIILVVIGIFYLLSDIKIFRKKTHIVTKLFFALLLTILGVVFSYGIYYLDSTDNFLGNITGALVQKDTHYIMVLKDSNYNKLDELQDKKIGIYKLQNEENANKALDLIKKKISFEDIEYEDLAKMLIDLKENIIDAIIINDATKIIIENNIFENDIELKELDSVGVIIENSKVTDNVNVTKSVFNVFIAGGDSYGSITKPMNTDVNMVATVDPVNKKILLTSIPRDYYVKLPKKCKEVCDKLTHAGAGGAGIEGSILAVEELLGIDINYYVKVNFSTVEKLVDAIGGIDVHSDMKFCTYYEHLCYEEGINHLDGYHALMFARERHIFVNGDIQRVKDQQYVISALINKITSSKTLITNYPFILNAISDNIAISMTQKEISSLVKMQLNDMASWNIESQNLVGHDGRGICYSLPQRELYIMLQDEESVKTAKNKINEFMGVTNE